MSDLRSRMERLGERALVEQGAFERLERRRRRKVRNRRTGAAALALVLTVGGSVVAFSVFRGDGELRIGGGEAESGFHALWPDTTLAEAEAEQEAVAAGAPDLQWRLSADATASMFAQEVLLLADFTIDGLTIVNQPVDNRTGPVSVRIETPPLPCPTPVTQPSDCAPPSDFIVTLDRLVGPGGVWSVTSVESSELPLPAPIGAEVQIGAELQVPTSLPEGTRVSAGYATTDACEVTAETMVEVHEGLLRFSVPDGVTGCDGYLYLMLPATPEGQVAIGRIMFVYYGAKPSLGYHVQAMAAVPVRFVEPATGGSTGEVPDVARVTCDGADIVVETPVVRTQPDGFHVVVRNVGDEPLGLSVRDLGSTVEGDGNVAVSGGEGGGDNAPPGETTTVWTFPPGTYSFSCSPPIEPGQGGIAGIGTLDVVDPDGHYVPAEIQCANGEAYGSAPAYAVGVGATGFAGDPVQVVRDHVSGLKFDDLVERAGYPESEQPVVRVVRDGVVAGKVTLFDDGQGGWRVSAIEGCGGTQFGWSEEPTGVSGPAVSGPTDSGSPFLVLCQLTRAEAEGDNIHYGTDIHVDGENLEFDTDCLVASAGEPLTILFTNLDGDVARNISIYAMTPCLQERLVLEQMFSCGNVENDLPIFTGEIITGVSEIVYEVGPLDHGYYYFQDDVHAAADGVLIVE